MYREYLVTSRRACNTCRRAMGSAIVQRPGVRHIVVAALYLCLIAAAQTQAATGSRADFPQKPIRIIVASGPGGGLDLTTRPVAQKLSEAFSVPVVVDTRGGGSGAIAMDLTHFAAPDGYTLLVGATTIILSAVTGKVSYDIRQAFAPVAHLTIQPYLLVIHPSLAARTPKEFVALAKSKPGALTYGTSGEGSLHNLGMDVFQDVTGTNVIHVPYKGSGPALIDLLAGQINFMFTSTISAAPHIRSGKLRALAVTSRERIPAYPELPSLSETVAPGYELHNNYFMLAPSRTPATVLRLLNGEVARIASSREMRDRFTAEGAQPGPAMSVGELREAYSREVTKWEQVTKNRKAK